MRGALEALGTMLAVVAFGLGWAEVEAAGAGGYPGSMAGKPGAEVFDHRLRPGPEPAQWLVDGFNLMHAVVLGGRERSEWWTEERRAEVLGLAARLDARGAGVWVVFDGPEERCGEREAEGGVRQVFAPSADDWLVERVRSSGDPSRIHVVTADRELVRRIERCGARILSPMRFAELCRPPEAVP